MKGWLVAHHMTLMAIADTPHSIALGSAIGIFFGFTPLYPLKTLLSIAVAWICRCNKIAAAIAVTLHDVLIWAMPAIYVAEYHLGCWTLNPRPHAAYICGNSDCATTSIGMCFHGSFGLPFGQPSLGRYFSRFLRRSSFIL